MRRPWTVLIPTVAILLIAGSPFLDLQLANSDVNQLPTSAEARQGADLLQAQFPQVGQNTIAVVVDFQHGAPTSPANVAASYQLAQRLSTLKGVTGVRSYVTVEPTLTLSAYQTLYAQPRDSLPSAVQSLLTNLTGKTIAVLDVANPYFVTSDQAHDLVRAIRAVDSIPGATVQVTGDSAFDIDLVNYMIDHTPLAIGFVLITTIIVLTLLLRSLVLPFKAVLMNALSLSAAFGALVWVFVQGHLSGFLGFTPGPLDPTIPVLLFCVVFGLSMDYEVFLLTRMQEAWVRTGDNRTAVADGLERSGRLVTGAAAIMACVFLAFALASVVTIKSIGIGMAVAVIADATLVRALVVPGGDATPRRGQLVGAAMAPPPRARLPGDRSRCLIQQSPPPFPHVHRYAGGVISPWSRSRSPERSFSLSPGPATLRVRSRLRCMGFALSCCSR